MRFGACRMRPIRCTFYGAEKVHRIRVHFIDLQRISSWQWGLVELNLQPQKMRCMERTTFGMTFYIRRTKLDKTGKAPVFCVSQWTVCVPIRVSSITYPHNFGIQPRAVPSKTAAKARRWIVCSKPSVSISCRCVDNWNPKEWPFRPKASCPVILGKTHPNANRFCSDYGSAVWKSFPDYGGVSSDQIRTRWFLFGWPAGTVGRRLRVLYENRPQVRS